MKECNACDRSSCRITAKFGVIRAALEYRRRHAHIRPTQDQMSRPCSRHAKIRELRVPIVEHLVFTDKGRSVLSALNVKVKGVR